jgi:hypothetical protein
VSGSSRSPGLPASARAVSRRSWRSSWATCPGFRIGVAEQPLGVGGERPYRLRPLAESPAVELFRQRAEAAEPGFTADYKELAGLCRRLGRLPLAIEVFAARGSAGLREPGDRRWPLREAIEWSYDRVDDGDKEALRSFAAGNRLDDASADRLLRLRLLSPTGHGVRIHPAIRDVALGA